MEKLPKIPENANKLTEDASIEVMCSSRFDELDMVSFFNQCGYNTVSSDDERAADPSTFMYDKQKSMFSTPFVKPENVLPLMQELQQKFEQNKIGYFIFKTKYRDQFLEPKLENQPEILSDEEVLKHLRSQNLEMENVCETWENCFRKNISDKGPLKIYRGTAMGDSAHITISQSTSPRGVFAYATPNILSAISYAHHDVSSRFGFVEEYQASPNQIYSCDHGLESNECLKDINWHDLREANKAFETFVEKETNPHLRTYLAYNGKLYKIYENGQYVDKFWEKYAQSRRPQIKYRNDNIAKRVQNIIDEGRHEKFVAKKQLMEEHPIMTDLSLASMCNLYFLTKNEVIKKEMLGQLYEIRKKGNSDKEKRDMAKKFKCILNNNPDLNKDENLVALSKIDTFFSQLTKRVKKQIEVGISARKL